MGGHHGSASGRGMGGNNGFPRTWRLLGKSARKSTQRESGSATGFCAVSAERVASESVAVSVEQFLTRDAAAHGPGLPRDRTRVPQPREQLYGAGGRRTMRRLWPHAGVTMIQFELLLEARYPTLADRSQHHERKVLGAYAVRKCGVSSGPRARPRRPAACPCVAARYRDMAFYGKLGERHA